MAAFTVIDHTEATGLTASFEETGISGSYDHLYMVASVRSDIAATSDTVWLQLNGEGANFYSMTSLQGASGGPFAGRTSTGTAAYQQAWVDIARVNGNTSTADTFGMVTMWLPHYSNTANFKQAVVTSYSEGASTTISRLRLGAGLFHSTAAITEVKLSPYNLANDWMEFSTFTLYGVTGA
tara:strand:- start:42 stop:584 length:543 start_codon:yes stop_codon:yes gene_type:complete